MKKWMKWVCSFALVGCLACMAPLQAFAASSSDIQAQIEAYMADLEASQRKSDSLKEEIAAKQEEVGALYSEVETLNMQKAIYYEAMKERMVYFYEEARGTSWLSALFGATSFVDFLNRVQYQQALYDYDAAQLDAFEVLVEEVEEKQATLDAEIENLGDMVEEQAILQATLNATIATKEQEYETVKAEEEAAAAEAAAKAAAAEAAAKAAEAEKQKRATTDSVAYVSGGSGALTKSKGVVWYNGHKETYYSQRVLPGNNLNIPGRHVDERGVICDGDGYVCVASYEYPKGTIIETSLGTGKVYDWCATPGVIDIYTDW